MDPVINSKYLPKMAAPLLLGLYVNDSEDVKNMDSEIL